MRAFLPVAVAVLSIAFATSALRAVAGDDDKCPLDKLPAKVTAAVKAKWPKAEMVSATKEEEKGKTLYEVKMKDGETEIAATFTEDGVLTEIEKTVPAKDLPKAVTDAITAKYPKSVIDDRVIAYTQGEKTSYEVSVKTAEKKHLYVSIDANGKITSEEEAEEEEKGGDKEKGMGEEGMGGGDMK